MIVAWVVLTQYQSCDRQTDRRSRGFTLCRHAVSIVLQTTIKTSMLIVKFVVCSIYIISCLSRLFPDRNKWLIDITGHQATPVAIWWIDFNLFWLFTALFSDSVKSSCRRTYLGYRHDPAWVVTKRFQLRHCIIRLYVINVYYINCT